VEGDEPVSGWGRWTAEQIALRYPFSLSILCALCSLLFSCGCCWRLFFCSWCSLGGVAWAASVWRFPFSVVHDSGLFCLYLHILGGNEFAHTGGEKGLPALGL
jgi:hypothetical protein